MIAGGGVERNMVWVNFVHLGLKMDNAERVAWDCW